MGYTMKKQIFLLALFILTLSGCKEQVEQELVPTAEELVGIDFSEPEIEISETTEPTLPPTPTEQVIHNPVKEAQEMLSEYLSIGIKITYMPDFDKTVEDITYFGFVIDYSDNLENEPFHSSAYAWVEPLSGYIEFQEFGYTEATGPNWYANFPDGLFPIPMIDGVIIPYDWFEPPDYVWGVSYMYEDENIFDIYQEQLRGMGFTDYGEVQSVYSLWGYKREHDGASLIVEMYKGKGFVMNLYVNYLNPESRSEQFHDEATYSSAYLNIINEYEEEDAGLYMYDLVYIDNDDVPELVVFYFDPLGYYISLYTYVDGTIYPIEDVDGYQLYHKYGYEYLPKSNIIYTFDPWDGGLNKWFYQIDENFKLRDYYEDLLILVLADDENEERYFLGDIEITEAQYEAYSIKGDYERIIGKDIASVIRHKLVSKQIGK